MENPQDKKEFSYPNADRPVGDLSPTDGPRAPTAHPIVHIDEALEKGKSENKDKTPTIHTFQSDVANAIHTDNVSMIKVALAEKKRKEKQGTFDETAGAPAQNKMIVVFIGIVILLLLIAGGVWFGWNYFKAQTQNDASSNDPAVSLTSRAPIEFEQVVLLNIDGKYVTDIEQAVRAEKNNELPFGTMKQIIFTKKIPAAQNDLGTTSSKTRPAILSEWLSSIRSRASDSLIRALDPYFAFGIYSYTPHDSFVLLKVNSYDNAYAGMLEWERYMEPDLQGQLVNRPSTDTALKASSSAPTSSGTGGKTFVDRVINNKDSRVLLDDSGNIMLLYSFIDQNTLVIASSDKALKEIIFRLTTGRIVR